MEVLIVNAKENTIRKADINNSLETFYEIIGTDSISIIARNINGKMTQIICDEEGKLKADQYVSAVSNDINEYIYTTDNDIHVDFNYLVYQKRKEKPELIAIFSKYEDAVKCCDEIRNNYMTWIEEVNEFLVGNLIFKSQDKSIIDDFNKNGVITYSRYENI